MKGKRNNNWKRILTGWIFAVLLFGSINDCPEMPPANPEGLVAQMTEGQEGEPETYAYTEPGEEKEKKN